MRAVSKLDAPFLLAASFVSSSAHCLTPYLEHPLRPVTISKYLLFIVTFLSILFNQCLPCSRHLVRKNMEECIVLIKDCNYNKRIKHKGLKGSRKWLIVGPGQSFLKERLPELEDKWEVYSVLITLLIMRIALIGMP